MCKIDSAGNFLSLIYDKKIVITIWEERRLYIFNRIHVWNNNWMKINYAYSQHLRRHELLILLINEIS